MNKTYAEEMGEFPFDWNRFLDQAIDNPKSVSQSKHAQVIRMSREWTTCACGNQCAIIPRDPDTGSPFDDTLSAYGVDFHRQVVGKEWERAKETLKKIEHRSNVLIKQEMSKLQGTAS